MRLVTPQIPLVLPAAFTEEIQQRRQHQNKSKATEHDEHRNENPFVAPPQHRFFTDAFRPFPIGIVIRSRRTPEIWFEFTRVAIRHVVGSFRGDAAAIFRLAEQKRKVALFTGTIAAVGRIGFRAFADLFPFGVAHPFAVEQSTFGVDSRCRWIGSVGEITRQLITVIMATSPAMLIIRIVIRGGRTPPVDLVVHLIDRPDAGVIELAFVLEWDAAESSGIVAGVCHGGVGANRFLVVHVDILVTETPPIAGTAQLALLDQSVAVNRRKFAHLKPRSIGELDEFAERSRSPDNQEEEDKSHTIHDTSSMSMALAIICRRILISHQHCSRAMPVLHE